LLRTTRAAPDARRGAAPARRAGAREIEVARAVAIGGRWRAAADGLQERGGARRRCATRRRPLRLSRAPIAAARRHVHRGRRRAAGRGRAWAGRGGLGSAFELGRHRRPVQPPAAAAGGHGAPEARHPGGGREPRAHPWRSAEESEAAVPRFAAHSPPPHPPRLSSPLAQQLDVEHELRVGRNRPPRAARAVSELGRNNEPPHAARLHGRHAVAAEHALAPALDDLLLLKSERAA